MDTFDAKTPPFVSKDVLEPRFRAKTRARGEGCLEWTGCKCKRLKNRPDEGQIRVSAGPKDYRVLSASRVSWWLAGNGWPEAGAQLQHTCGHRDCVAPGHLKLVTLAQRTKLTPERRAAIRQLYARRVAVQREVFGRLGVTRKPSAVSLASKRLWLSRGTIERFATGGRMSPRHWCSDELTVDELKQVYELAGRDADSILKKLNDVEAYSIKNLARRYGVSSSAIGRALYTD